MTSYELAHKLLALPEQSVLVWTDGNPDDFFFHCGSWQPVKSFTVGDKGIKFSELEHD